MRIRISSGVLTLVLYACGVLAAQSLPNANTYQWHGELVAFDATAKTVTIKAGFVDQYAAADATRFKAGDGVLLVWSATGLGIRRIAQSGESPKTGERFLLPAELVSTETLNPANQNHYLTFRLPVSESSVSALKGVKPGEWVTVTSPISRGSAAIVSLRPYPTVSTRPPSK